MIACQNPRSMGFPRQEYWSGLPFPPPGYLPDSGIKPTSPTLASRFLTNELPGKPSCKQRQLEIPSSPGFKSTFSSVQSLSRVRLCVTPGTAARQASLSITNSWSVLKVMSTESVMPSNHLILCYPRFSSRLQFSPASGSFPVSQFFASGGQSIGVSASASVLPTNIQD